MNQPTPRYWEVFLEVFEALPRQGPGTYDCASRAIGFCRGLPSAPAVLDLGCGAGGQTFHLAQLTSGSILAIDSHAPLIERLGLAVAERGLTRRIRPMVGDIARLDLPPGSFDLIWSEGALYNIGIETALRKCRPLLRAGGHLAFSDAVWRKADPPPEVQALFADYPAMGRASDALSLIERCGYEVLGHFTLPDAAWWDDFYTPMLRQIELLRTKCSSDAETLEMLTQIQREPDLHRAYADYYGYEFFVTRRTA